MNTNKDQDNNLVHIITHKINNSAKYTHHNHKYMISHTAIHVNLKIFTKSIILMIVRHAHIARNNSKTSDIV